MLWLALDSKRGENSLLARWQEFQTCTPNAKTLFRTCIAEKFPPGSDYRELETFLLEKKGFSKVRTEPVEGATKVVFGWRPPDIINVGNYAITVIGRYDKESTILEVIVN